MSTENLLNLKIHKMSNATYEQYKKEEKLDNTALYLTPEDPPTDAEVILSEDLYTYAPVGIAQTASAGEIGSGSIISSSNPGKIGQGGESLKDVFKKVFGEEIPIQPAINTSNVKLLITSNAGTYGGGEFGTSVSGITITYTITLSNSAMAQYGYKCGDAEPNTAANASIYYPAKEAYTYDGSTAQLKITLPSSVNDVAVTRGTLVNTDTTNNILYCNFNDRKTVHFTVSLASTTVTKDTQTRYGAVSAEVTLGTAQTEDTNKALPMSSADSSKIVTSFLAYKPVTKSYVDSTVVVDGTNIGNTGVLTDSEPAIYVDAGYVPYAWELATAAVAAKGNLPSTNKRQSAYTNISINDANGTKNLYIYVPSNKSIEDIKNNNQAAPFACDSSSRELKVNGRSTTFKVYHVIAPVAEGKNNYTITYS